MEPDSLPTIDDPDFPPQEAPVAELLSSEFLRANTPVTTLGELSAAAELQGVDLTSVDALLRSERLQRYLARRTRYESVGDFLQDALLNYRNREGHRASFSH